MQPTKQQLDELLTRGVAEVIDREHLKARLLKGEKLRLKLGIDPTGPDLHIGHAVVLWKLRAFQELGHQVIIVVGDFTATIGDPSGHDKMREPLTPAQIKKNLTTFKKQALMVLDPKRTEFAPQTKWFDKMTPQDIMGLTTHFSAWRILERDLFERRKKMGEELSLLELFYPVFQAYDSVAIKAEVEFGGTDQTFNLLQGRKIQPHFGQKPQDIFTMQLLEGLDGRKMSKTYGNTVNLLDAPEEKYGKIMSLRDDLMVKYFALCTRLPLDEITRILKQNPRDAKMRLAREIVALYHGAKAAQRAEDQFVRTFQKHEIPSEISEIRIKDQVLNIVELLVKAKLAESKGDARRVVEQGGVQVDGKVVKDPNAEIKLGKQGVLLQKGKRHFVRVYGA
ncbi:tyrosine--tRNA ligase [Candidatus Uhrbacteria bacterium]|nr:tyrosine--tRNA ligase [Candidatus Uhrbacteria bacterium]